MTNPEQPLFLWEFALETNLLKACVRSVVYHLKTDVKTLHAATKRSHKMYEVTGFTTWELKDIIKRAENHAQVRHDNAEQGLEKEKGADSQWFGHVEV